MFKLSLLAFTAALLGPSNVLAQDMTCGTAERMADGLLARADVRTVDGKTGGSISLTIKAPGSPLTLIANMAAVDGKVDAPYLLFGEPATPNLHAPIRSTTTSLKITARDGRTWQSKPTKPRYPNAAKQGEKVYSWSDVLAERRPGAPARNVDLLDAIAAGESLNLRLEGDAGEEFGALEVPAVKPATQAKLYADVLDAAMAHMTPCGPPMISNVPPTPDPPRLYLSPADSALLAQTPTLEDLIAINPPLERERQRGTAVLHCIVGEQGQLGSCYHWDRSPSTLAIGRASRIAADQVHVAMRFPDGRRTEGLALLLAVRWDKKALSFAIVPSNGAAVPAP